MSSGLYKGFIVSDSHRSNVNEVIRAVLNFFYKKISRAQKKNQTHVTSQNQLKKRIKTSKRMKIVCLFRFFSEREKKKIEKREKSPQCRCTKYRCPHN